MRHYKTTLTVGVLRNHLASAADTAVQRHLPGVFRKKRLNTVDARASYIANLFKSPKEHPIIYREYIEGNIQNHPEVGGYKTVRYFLYTPTSLLNVSHRPGVVFSCQTLSLRPSKVTTLRMALWKTPHSKIQEPQTDR